MKALGVGHPQAFRVFEPGGAFAGSDLVRSLSFRLKHMGDVYNPLAPDELTERLDRIGFVNVNVNVNVAGGRQRWRATKPAA